MPMGLVGVYALQPGIAVDTIQLGGIGQPWNPPASLGLDTCIDQLG